MSEVRAAPGRPGGAPPARLRAELADEAAFLRLSLEDLERELAAGELARPDYEDLRRRYEDRAAAVAESLQQLGDGARSPVPAERPKRRLRLATRRHRLVLGWVAAACFAAAGALLGLAVAGVAPFARSSPQLSAQSRIDIELAEAAVLAGHGHVPLAVQTYDKVLAIDPEQQEALTDGGWLVRLAGLSSSRPSLVAEGDREIAAAAALHPGYALAHGYEGVALLEDRRDARAAVASFRVMLADHPTGALLSSVREEAVAAFAAVHIPLPAALAR
jgi:hypothetical protein